MSSLFAMFREQLDAFWSSIREGDGEDAFLPILRPVAPYDGPLFRNPIASLGIVLALVTTSGIAIGALGVLLVALLALYFLLTDVLGISIEVRPIPA